MESLSFNQYIIKYANKNIVGKYELKETEYEVGENKKISFWINK